MAACADGHGYGTADGIYDIEVEELGPAACDERGLVVSEGHLSDRMEFGHISAPLLITPTPA